MMGVGGRCRGLETQIPFGNDNKGEQRIPCGNDSKKGECRSLRDDKQMRRWVLAEEELLGA